MRLLGNVSAIALLPVLLHAQFGIPGIGGIGAQPVIDYAALIQWASQLKAMADQIKQAVDTYREIVRQGQQLGGLRTSDVAADIARAAAIVQGARSIAYSLGNIDAVYRQRFPGFGAVDAPYYDRYRVWSETALDTLRGTARATGVSWEQLQNEQALIKYWQSQAGSLTTPMQAAQLGNSLNLEALNQLAKLRQLFLADMQAKQAYRGYQLQKQIDGAQAAAQFWSGGSGGADESITLKFGAQREFGLLEK